MFQVDWFTQVCIFIYHVTILNSSASSMSQTSDTSKAYV